MNVQSIPKYHWQMAISKPSPQQDSTNLKTSVFWETSIMNIQSFFPSVHDKWPFQIKGGLYQPKELCPQVDPNNELSESSSPVSSINRHFQTIFWVKLSTQRALNPRKPEQWTCWVSCSVSQMNDHFKTIFWAVPYSLEDLCILEDPNSENAVLLPQHHWQIVISRSPSE